MSWLAWSLVIFLTGMVVYLGPAWLIERDSAKLAKLEQIQLRARLEEGMGRVQLPQAGRLELEGPFDLPTVLLQTGPYGPFPVDTGPLLILSEQAAASVALEREIRQRCAEAEAKIPPRWR